MITCEPPKTKSILVKIKRVVGQYKNTMEYLKRSQHNTWKQKKFHPIKTRLSVLFHWIKYTK